MSLLTVIIKHLVLAYRLQVAAPWLDAEAVHAHVAAAQAAETDQVSSELLLGMAFVESRYDPTAVSRVEGRTRRTGRYPSTEPPAHLNRHASLYCGPLQTFAPSWQACVGMRRLDTAYAAATLEIEGWLRDRRVHGNMARALSGHGCGNFGVRTGSCNGYAMRVRMMERKFLPSDDRRHGGATVAATM